MPAYLTALALTITIEIPLYAWVLGPGARRLGARPATIGAGALTGLVVNLVSHPLAFLVVEPIILRPLAAPLALVLVEALVLVGEFGIVLVRHRDPVVAAVSAGVANLVSLSIGLAVI